MTYLQTFNFKRWYIYIYIGLKRHKGSWRLAKPFLIYLAKTLRGAILPPPVQIALTLLPTGEILSHTTIILAATLKPLKLWLPKFVTSCFYLFSTFKKILAKSIGQGGCYSHFSNKRSWKIRDMKIFIFVKNGWDT